MRTGEDASVRFPFMTEFSARDRAVAEKAIERLDDEKRKASASRGKKLEEIGEVCRRRFHALLGAKKTAELRAAIERERLAFRELWDPPAGLLRDYGKERQASRRRIGALARKLGASPTKIGRITRRCDEQLRATLSAVGGKVTPGFNLSKNYKKWIDLSPLHEFPLPWVLEWPVDDPNDPHRWFLFKPPFFGFLFSFTHVASDTYVVDRELFLNPSAGLVGNVATMDCHDTDDFAIASADCQSQIAFGFVPPVAGVVEVLIDAQCTIDRHHLQINDEFGLSNAWAGQTSFLMMNVLHPNVPVASMAQMSTFYDASGGDNLDVNRELLTRGTHYVAHLFSSGPVPAGQSVVVTAGARSFDIAHADEMEMHSRSNCQWFINSVEVRISP